ncbi:hypothetical protein T492DRAFT_416783 [Pavlovales sp. CCMP2436]|nr:hypothetical protein T492DRAFT_416783 [Pavlovales sp. CCMP2436]
MSVEEELPVTEELIRAVGPVGLPQLLVDDSVDVGAHKRTSDTSAAPWPARNGRAGARSTVSGGQRSEGSAHVPGSDRPKSSRELGAAQRRTTESELAGWQPAASQPAGVEEQPPTPPSRSRGSRAVSKPAAASAAADEAEAPRAAPKSARGRPRAPSTEEAGRASQGRSAI